LLLSGIGIANAGSAIGLYSDCYFADDFGGRRRDSLVVSPIGEICNKRCQNECNSLSRDSTKIQDSEANKTQIQSCKQNCLNGRKNISYPIISDDPNDPGETIVKTITIQSACGTGGAIDSPDYTFYKSDLQVEQNEDVFVKLMSLPGTGYGSVSLCKGQSVEIKPSFASMNPSEWSSNSNKWSTTSESASSWNARNPRITDTGILVRDGDFVSITMSFKNGYRKYLNDTGADTRNLYIRKPLAFADLVIWDISSNELNNIYEVLPGEKLIPIRNEDSDPPKYVDINGDEVTNPGEIFKANSEVTWHGLSGSADFIESDGERYITLNFAGRLKDFSKKYTLLGITHFDGGNRQSAWSDNLGGIDVSISTIGCIYDYRETQPTENPSDSTKTIRNFNDGRLEYAITNKIEGTDEYNPEFELPLESDWRPLDPKILKQYESFKAPKSGQLYFRIRPLDYNSSTDGPECSQMLSSGRCIDSRNKLNGFYGAVNSFGQYYIRVEIADLDNTVAPNYISGSISNVRNYFFGKGDNSEGTVQYIFNSFISNSQLVKTIEAALLFFMTWTGLSYMVGIAQITQRDLIIRLFNLGVIITLLQPGSWKFFNTYLFSLFIDGGGDLIANIIDYKQFGLAENQLSAVAKDPSLVFSIFDKVFGILFSEAIWYKLAALVFSGWLGIYVMMSVLVAIAIYFIVLLKAVLIYTASLVFLGILLILAPIFFTFLLFKYTRKMFMSWISQLITVTLQPVVVIASISIFTYIFLACLYAALGFTACRSCLVGFGLSPIFDFTCIIPKFITLNFAHGPEDAILQSPINNLAAGFCILIIAQAMYVFVDFAIGLVNAIINQNFFTGVDLSGYSNVSDYTTAVISPIGKIANFALGTSDGVKAKTNKLMYIPNNIGKGYNDAFKINEKQLDKVLLRVDTKLNDMNNRMETVTKKLEHLVNNPKLANDPAQIRSAREHLEAINKSKLVLQSLGQKVRQDIRNNVPPEKAAANIRAMVSQVQAEAQKQSMDTAKEALSRFAQDLKKTADNLDKAASGKHRGNMEALFADNFESSDAVSSGPKLSEPGQDVARRDGGGSLQSGEGVGRESGALARDDGGQFANREGGGALNNEGEGVNRNTGQAIRGDDDDDGVIR